jgi:hypothetical protein
LRKKYYEFYEDEPNKIKIAKYYQEKLEEYLSKLDFLDYLEFILLLDKTKNGEEVNEKFIKRYDFIEEAINIKNEFYKIIEEIKFLDDNDSVVLGILEDIFGNE